jgi:Zn-dependent protease with chaperone function
MVWAFDGPWRNFWPLILLPLLAGFISDRCSRGFPLIDVSHRCAIALAGLPGLVTLGLMAVAIWQSATRGIPHSIDGFILGVVTPAVAILLFLRATARASSRAARLRRLHGLSRRASVRLAAAAAIVGVRARELPTRDIECFISGFWRPVVHVSRGAVDRLSDVELEAVLHHERAHGLTGDPRMYAILGFLSDLAPMTGRALEAFRRAREQDADQVAARSVGVVPLASALLILIRGNTNPAAVAMGAVGGAWRLELLLGAAAPAPMSTANRAGIAAGIVSNAVLACWPLPHVALLYFYCTG